MSDTHPQPVQDESAAGSARSTTPRPGPSGGTWVFALIDRLWGYFGQDAMPRMAAALAYRTTFSLIPLLLCGFLVLRLFDAKPAPGAATSGLGPDDTIVGRLLKNLLDQTGLSAISTDKGNVNAWVTELVNKFEGINFGAIGLVSAGVLIYAALSLLVDIESSFNQVYGATRGRSWVKRIMQYWLMISLGPLLLYAGFIVGDQFRDWAKSQVGTVSALIVPANELVGPPAPEEVASVTAPIEPPAAQPGEVVKPPAPPEARGATLADRAQPPWVAGLIKAIGFGITASISAVLLLSLYLTVPNTVVRLRPAMLGALVAGVLLELAKTGFTTFFSAEGYKSLYGVLALLPMFLLWVYVLWFIVLFGLRVSFLIQHGKRGVLIGALRASARPGLGGAWLEPARSVDVVLGIAEAFERGRSASAQKLADRTGLDITTVEAMLGRLEEAGLVHGVATEGREATFALNRPVDSIYIDEVVAVGQAMSGPISAGSGGELMARIRDAQLTVVKGLTLGELMGRKKTARPAPEANGSVAPATLKLETPVAPQPASRPATLPTS